MTLVNHKEMWMNGLPHPIHPVPMALQIAAIQTEEGEKWVATEVPTATGIFAYFLKEDDIDGIIQDYTGAIRELRTPGLWTPDQSNGTKVIPPEQLRGGQN